MIRVWPVLLGFLTQFAGCTQQHLQQFRLKMDAVSVARIEGVHLAGTVGENQFILVVGKPDSWQPRTLIRVDADANEHSLILPTQDTACVGEALVVRGDRWAYSRCSGSGVQFVTSDAPGSPSFVAIDAAGEDAREWMPFEDGDPGGVLLSVERDQRSMIARKVTPSGVQETVARFDRASGLWGAERGQAVRLREDRLALITIETASDDPTHSSIVLRVVEDGEITTSRVAFHASGWASIAAAAGPNEELAIVAAPFDGSGVVAVIVDSERLDHKTIRQLTDTAAGVPHPGLRLIEAGDRFIAGWIDHGSRSVRIAEFDGRVVLPAATVAADVAAYSPAISLGRAPTENAHDVAVFWTEDGGRTMFRTLPEPPTGSLVVSDLQRALSEWVHGRAR